jgi:murein DD-endopeptidase MepM/ murein hydrolase activator NlpD
MAISSPILNVKTGSTKTKGTPASASTIKNIQQTLIKQGKVRKEILDRKKQFNNQRRENERRKVNEDILEASNLAIKPSGPIQMIQSSTKGFLERLLGFLGYLSAGWLMNNLPTWIAMGKEFVGRVQRMGQLIGGFVTNITNIFSGFGNLLSATFQNMIQFDLFDSSNRVKDAFGQLTGSIDDMGRELEEAIRLITTPLTEGMVTGEDAPATGTQRTDDGAYEPGAPLQSSGGGNISDTQRQALNILSKYESASSGGYNAVNQIGTRGGRGTSGFSGDFRNMQQHRGKSLTDMTIAEIMSLQAPRPGMSNQEWIRQGRLHAVGRYQFIGNTLPGVVSRSGIPTNAKFTPEVQDLLALQYMKERGIGAWIGPADKATREERLVIERARKEPISYRPPISSGRQTQAQLSPGRGVSTTVRDEVNIAGPSGGTPSVGLSREEGAQYLARRGGGRKHAGVDIGTSGQRGFYVSFKQSGKVTYARNNGRGYGNLVIIKSGNIEFYFAHLASILVKEGQQYNGETIGEIGKTGGNYPIHLHFEARPNGVPTNPKPYLGFLSIGRQLTGISGKPMNVPTPSSVSPAQMASIQSQQQRQQVSQQLAQDRKGPTVIFQQPPEPEPQEPSYSSGSTGMMPLQVDEFTLVNNFMKKKLLLDLAYL